MLSQIVGHSVQFEVKAPFIAFPSHLLDSLFPFPAGYCLESGHIYAFGISYQDVKMSVNAIFAYWCF
ncbi:hypothetical protein OX89_04270 [Diaphorobacter sp. J5-51]|nr:hypothetical protein OX89_04270 [Diaphorobacter sp. J5-51]